MKEYKRDVSYRLIRNTDGHIDFCVRTFHCGDKMYLDFDDGVMATFGGVSFPSSKSAWWHWYEYLRCNPQEKGTAKVVAYGA